MESNEDRSASLASFEAERSSFISIYTAQAVTKENPAEMRDDDDDVYLDKLQTRYTILYM
jgi:hypothetical protein